MRYYLIEFLNLDSCYQYEDVLAINAQEAVNSIKLGWPKCTIQNVWVSLDVTDKWTDLDVA